MASRFSGPLNAALVPQRTGSVLPVASAMVVWAPGATAPGIGEVHAGDADQAALPMFPAGRGGRVEDVGVGGVLHVGEGDGFRVGHARPGEVFDRKVHQRRRAVPLVHVRLPAVFQHEPGHADAVPAADVVAGVVVDAGHLVGPFPRLVVHPAAQAVLLAHPQPGAGVVGALALDDDLPLCAHPRRGVVGRIEHVLVVVQDDALEDDLVGQVAGVGADLGVGRNPGGVHGLDLLVRLARGDGRREAQRDDAHDDHDKTTAQHDSPPLVCSGLPETPTPTGPSGLIPRRRRGNTHCEKDNTAGAAIRKGKTV